MLPPYVIPAHPTSPKITVDTLPNEILSTILVELPTPALVSLTCVSYHFQAVALTVLQSRERHLEGRKDVQLHLTWYTPANGVIKSPFELKYLGTAACCSMNNCLMDCEADAKRFTNMYSRFSPGTHVGVFHVTEMADPTDHVQLDWFESFCQFCMKLELVTICDRKNLHSKNLTIENGIIRFHRFDLNPLEGARTKNFHYHAFDEQERICWVDRKRTIGLKVKVRRLSALTGVPDYNQNGQAEQYEITLKELLFRTTRFLAGVEDVEDHGFDNRWEVIVLHGL